MIQALRITGALLIQTAKLLRVGGVFIAVVVAKRRLTHK